MLRLEFLLPISTFQRMKLIQINLLLILSLLSACAQKIIDTDPIPNHQTIKIESKIIGETRTINIWTPENYQTNTNSLPVLYMPDGGVKEDFPHIANTLAKLIKAKKIAPLILVGIENTQRRRDLTGPTTVAKDKEIAPMVGGSEKFSAFIKNELFSEINKRYRTTSEKGIIGESLAGLFVTETFLQHPNLFDYYIAFDPSLWWNDQHLTKNATALLANFTTNPKRFWFAASNTIDIAPNVNQFAEILAGKNIPNLKWKHVNAPKEKHHTIYRATKEEAIIWTLNAK